MARQGQFRDTVVASLGAGRCSVEEPEQSQRVLRADGSQKTPVTRARTGAAENAGLRAGFKAP